MVIDNALNIREQFWHTLHLINYHSSGSLIQETARISHCRSTNVNVFERKLFIIREEMIYQRALSRLTRACNTQHWEIIGCLKQRTF